MTRRRSRRWRDRGDRGFAAAIEAPFAVLLLAATALMVVTFPTWVERRQAAVAAADEASRAMVLAGSWAEGTADAQAAVDEVAANYGLARETVYLELEGTWERGADVTAHVTVGLPAASLPLVGSVGGFSHTASHTETIEPYRSLG
jgi:Flp pilus assembly protein TadG